MFPITSNTPSDPLIFTRMKLLGRNKDTFKVLVEAVQMNVLRLIQLASVVPELYRDCSWTMAYSLDQHGASLTTLLSKAKGPCVLIALDSQGGLFGTAM